MRSIAYSISASIEFSVPSTICRTIGSTSPATLRLGAVGQGWVFEAATGREVNRKTLHFYRVLQAWSTVAMCASGLRAAQAHHIHQDILLTWLSMVTPSLVDELADLMMENGQ